MKKLKILAKRGYLMNNGLERFYRQVSSRNIKATRLKKKQNVDGKEFHNFLHWQFLVDVISRRVPQLS